MSAQVEIEKADGSGIKAASICHQTSALAERIRQRAFQFFEKRGRRDGFAEEDWLRAERDLLLAAESELIEKDGKYEIRVNTPGFDADEIKVTALPEALIVEGSSTHRHHETEGNVRFCEFGHKALFRRFDLPETINLDKVAANLEKGVLHLTAAKSKQESSTNQRAAAA